MTKRECVFETLGKTFADGHLGISPEASAGKGGKSIKRPNIVQDNGKQLVGKAAPNCPKEK